MYVVLSKVNLKVSEFWQVPDYGPEWLDLQLHFYIYHNLIFQFAMLRITLDISFLPFSVAHPCNDIL